MNELARYLTLCCEEPGKRSNPPLRNVFHYLHIIMKLVNERGERGGGDHEYFPAFGLGVMFLGAQNPRDASLLVYGGLKKLEVNIVPHCRDRAPFRRRPCLFH